MEAKQNTVTSKFAPKKKKERKSGDITRKNHYDLVDLKIKKHKSIDDTRTLQNFLLIRNKFKSKFDRKGAKKFLKEKEKAMEEMDLNDEIPEEKTENSQKSKSEDKYNEKNKHLIQNPSENELVYFEKKNSSKKQVVYKEENKNTNANQNASFVSFKNSKDFNYNTEVQNMNQQKGLIEPPKKKKKFAFIITNEPSFLMTGDDSFIYSIVKEMNE
jgi:hypothetical protein